MISYLEGKIKNKGLNYLIILTGGVGYKVYASTSIINSAKLENNFHLYIYTNVKDDAIDLYGFNSQDELALYELFLTVSGVGPKTALSIFSSYKIDQIKKAVMEADVEFFSSIPRLGKKNAQKIIIELRSKLGSLEELDLTKDSGENKEIAEALKSFGFSASESRDALKSLSDFTGDTSSKIKQALKYLGKK